MGAFSSVFKKSEPRNRSSSSSPSSNNAHKYSIRYRRGDVVTFTKCSKPFRVAFFHVANCFHTMGAGVSAAVKGELPMLYTADCATAKGDRSKLGTFSSVVFGWGVGYNLYGIYSPYDKNDMLDWDALERSLVAMFRDVERRGIKVMLMPKICSGLARGDLSEEEAWGRVVEMLNRVCPPGVQVMVVEHDPKSSHSSSEFWSGLGANIETIMQGAPMRTNASSEDAPSTSELYRPPNRSAAWQLNPHDSNESPILYVRGDAVCIAMSRKPYPVAFAHGCNCYCTMGAGIALEVRKRLPQLYAADRATKYGDRSKLGTFSSAVFDWGVGYNLYTQYSNYDVNDMVDWDAVKKSLAAMFRDVERRGIKVVVMPKICSGLARGNLSEEEAWSRVVDLLDRLCSSGVDVVVVEYDSAAAASPSECSATIVGRSGLLMEGAPSVCSGLSHAEVPNADAMFSPQLFPPTKKLKTEEDRRSDANNGAKETIASWETVRPHMVVHSGQILADVGGGQPSMLEHRGASGAGNSGDDEPGNLRDRKMNSGFATRKRVR